MMKNIVKKFRDELYNATMEKIWKPRCEILKEIERSLNVGVKKKRNIIKNNKVAYSNPFRKIDNENKIEGTVAIKRKSYVGGNILDNYNIDVDIR